MSVPGGRCQADPAVKRRGWGWGGVEFTLDVGVHKGDDLGVGVGLVGHGVLLAHPPGADDRDAVHHGHWREVWVP